MGGAGDLLAGPKGAPLTAGWAVKGWVHGCLGGSRRKEEEGHGAGALPPPDALPWACPAPLI